MAPDFSGVVADVEISLLGPFIIRAGGVNLGPTAPKPRQVLALLAMHANQVVSVSALIRELWDEDPPRSALATLQTYILQLRRLLATTPGIRSSAVSNELLITSAGGYLLRLDPELLDLHRFERLATEGRTALARNDDERAGWVLREALAEWRGQPLVDVHAGPLLRFHLVRLEEARLTALEHRFEADLRIGLHREVLSELAFLAAQHPLHENLHAELMVALYRSGRRSEALTVFHRMRARLVDELGLEPSMKMQRIQQAILATAPGLDVPQRRSSLAISAFAPTAVVW